MQQQKIISAFDFDGTLTCRDTFSDFSSYVLGRRKWLLSLLGQFPYLIGWKLGFIKAEKAKQRLFASLFSGMDAEDFREWGRKYASRINMILRPSVVGKLKEAVERGDVVLIVSASIADWIRPWAASNGADDVLATEVEVGLDGKLTGRFSTPNCNGAEKVRRIMKACPDRKEALLVAYGDSRGDSKMLREADYPHYV